MGKDHAVLAYQGYFSAGMVGQRLGPETGEIGHCTGDMDGAVKAALGREGRRLMAKFTRPGATPWKSPVMSVPLSASALAPPDFVVSDVQAGRNDRLRRAVQADADPFAALGVDKTERVDLTVRRDQDTAFRQQARPVGSDRVPVLVAHQLVKDADQNLVGLDGGQGVFTQYLGGGAGPRWWRRRPPRPGW
jgi:hypothetical protein